MRTHSLSCKPLRYTCLTCSTWRLQLAVISEALTRVLNDCCFCPCIFRSTGLKLVSMHLSTLMYGVRMQFHSLKYYVWFPCFALLECRNVVIVSLLLFTVYQCLLLRVSEFLIFDFRAVWERSCLYFDVQAWSRCRDAPQEPSYSIN